MDIAIQKKIDTWKSGNYDAETKATIAKMSEDELIDSFYKDLEFGTGGLRGTMGVGSNRINKYTVGAATQGLSNYLKKAFPHEQVKVAVAHDSRNNSPLFASIVADVFSANTRVIIYHSPLWVS
jgi:phosphoglucomutase